MGIGQRHLSKSLSFWIRRGPCKLWAALRPAQRAQLTSSEVTSEYPGLALLYYLVSMDSLEIRKCKSLKGAESQTGVTSHSVNLGEERMDWEP